VFPGLKAGEIQPSVPGLKVGEIQTICPKHEGRGNPNICSRSEGRGNSTISSRLQGIKNTMNNPVLQHGIKKEQITGLKPKKLVNICLKAGEIQTSVPVFKGRKRV
jgi:hypothetical protein